VDAQYSTFRTLRKLSTTQLERAGFGDEFVDRMNRWRSQEGAKGRAVKRRMNAHYAEAVLLMPTTWLGVCVTETPVGVGRLQSRDSNRIARAAPT
jgi:hypothetical protein